MANKNKRLGINLAMIALGVLMLTFSSYHYYRLFCKVTGFNGTTQVAKQAPKQILDRMVTIRFNSDTDPTLGWEFKPEQIEMKVHVGENGLAFFKAVNNSGVTKTGSAIYNVTPEKVGQYFNKIQCFCFTKQTIKPGATAEFPVSFFVDPAFAADHYMDDVDTITLSYTFYEAKPDGTPNK